MEDFTNREDFIKEKMQEHCNFLLDKYIIVALFLQGSQNYKTDLYTNEYMSDVDTKAIIVPRFEDIVQNKTPVSYVHIMPDNSHIEVKDIRIMEQMWKKQNISYLELLYTEHKIINIKYEDYINDLYSIRDEISSSHKNQLLRCLKGMSENKIKALCHPYEGLIDKIDKYGYDSKQLLHILRINDFLKQWLDGEDFVNCYTPKEDTLNQISLIRKYHYGVEDAVNMANVWHEDTVELIDKYICDNKEFVDYDTHEKIRDVTADMIRYTIKKELMEK